MSGESAVAKMIMKTKHTQPSHEKSVQAQVPDYVNKRGIQYKNKVWMVALGRGALWVGFWLVQFSSAFSTKGKDWLPFLELTRLSRVHSFLSQDKRNRSATWSIRTSAVHEDTPYTAYAIPKGSGIYCHLYQTGVRNVTDIPGLTPQPWLARDSEILLPLRPQCQD